MSFKAIEIDKKKYVLRGDFALVSDSRKVFKKTDVEDNPAEYEAELNALLAIEGQNTLVEEEIFKAELKERQALEKKRNANKS